MRLTPNARFATFVGVLFVASAVISISSAPGQAIATKRIVANRNRPFQIIQGRGPGGPLTVAYVNGVAIFFEASNEVEAPADGDDETIEERQRQQAARPRISSGNIDQLTFGIGSDLASAEIATELLNIQLREQLKVIDAACELTPAQRKKLSLAGRGDIKHFIDRAATLRASIEKPDDILTEDQFRNWVTPLGEECEQMRQRLHSGLFGPGSLFFKIQGVTLTPEQMGLLVLAKLRDSEPSVVPHRGLPAPK
jgi:hypothetical protein